MFCRFFNWLKQVPSTGAGFTEGCTCEYLEGGERGSCEAVMWLLIYFFLIFFIFRLNELAAEYSRQKWMGTKIAADIHCTVMNEEQI